MNNIKGATLSNDGTMKRISVTYDVLDDEGKIVEQNKRISRVVTDENVLSAVTTIYDYAESIIE